MDRPIVRRLLEVVVAAVFVGSLISAAPAAAQTAATRRTCSSSVTPRSMVRRVRRTRPGRSSAWPPPPPATGTGSSPSDGGTFAYGDAAYHGSAAAPDRYRRVVGIAPTPTGGGYWLVTSGECVFSGSTADRTFRPDSHVMQQTDIRAGAHECFGRVVFTFSVEAGPADGTTSDEIGYRSPPFAGPSGTPVDVAGGAFLEVLLFGARAYDGQTGAPTYTGPAEIRPGLTAIRELQLVEDFEALLVWVVGVDRRRPFNVFQLDGPDRLVIDVGHG